MDTAAVLTIFDISITPSTFLASKDVRLGCYKNFLRRVLKMLPQFHLSKVK